MIKLSPLFIDYLNKDGVFMPEQNPEYDDQSESSEDEKPNYQIKEVNEINPLLIQEAAMLRE